jgi:glycerophosphoryl diester phosphodiesterase
VKQLLVQSHRGGGLLTPENTIETLIETWNLGAVPEADLRTTSDGVIVAFHDKNFARVVKDIHSDLREKGVQDVTFQELSALDVGSWKDDRFAEQRICSLVEIFTLMQRNSDHLLYMDIKDVKLPQLADLVQKFEVAKQVLFAAPDEQLLRDWKNLVPQSHTLLWMGILWNGDEGMLMQRLERLRHEDFSGITQLQIHVEATRNNGDWQFKPSLKFLRTIAVTLKSSGVLFQSLPWECVDEEVYRRLLEAGVQSFASDYPKVALRVLREWAEFHPLSD